MQLRLIAFAVLLCASGPSLACDLCAIYAAAEAQGQAPGMYAALVEQFTRYDQLRDQGHRVDDDAGQYLDSAVTQFVVGYGFSDRFNVQVGVPLIQRWFSRPEGDIVERGTESGLGDLNLIARYSPYRSQREDATLVLQLLAGLKLPTGNSDRLQEELGGEEESEPGVPVSGIHGHDLALGSGSTDLLFGASVQSRLQRWMGTADVQYAYRRRGDFDYRFGDDLQWSAGAGRYLVLTDDSTLGVLLMADGEYKKYDDLGGERLGDTHCGHVMLGPRLQWTYAGRYSVDAAAMIPVQTFNSEIQTTAGYRLRLAAGYRF